MADDHRMLIGGEWVPSESGAAFEATAPATGEVIGTLPEGTRGDAERAVRVEGLIPPSVDAGKRVFLYRVPRGAVGVISPWNWPYTMPREIVAPALAYGNTVVLAPAPNTSVCAVRLAERIAEADLPAGAFNLLTGPGPVVGDEI